MHCVDKSFFICLVAVILFYTNVDTSITRDKRNITANIRIKNIHTGSNTNENRNDIKACLSNLDVSVSGGNNDNNNDDDLNQQDPTSVISSGDRVYIASTDQPDPPNKLKSVQHSSNSVYYAFEFSEGTENDAQFTIEKVSSSNNFENDTIIRNRDIVHFRARNVEQLHNFDVSCGSSEFPDCFMGTMNASSDPYEGTFVVPLACEDNHPLRCQWIVSIVRIDAQPPEQQDGPPELLKGDRIFLYSRKHYDNDVCKNVEDITFCEGSMLCQPQDLCEWVDNPDSFDLNSPLLSLVFVIDTIT